MAKLHRRISRLPDRDPLIRGSGPCPRPRARLGALILALCVLACAPFPGVAVAQPDEEDVARLETLGAQLVGDDAEARQSAYDTLTRLSEDDLPAIEARLESLSRSRPPRNWASDILNRFRRHGSPAEGEDPDIAPGVLVELNQTHTIDMERLRVRLMAEPLLLFRSLERIGTHAAHTLAFRVIALDEGLWLPEARNWVRRRGAGVLAAAITARGLDDRYVRRWSRWAVEHLGAEDPGRVVQSLDEAQLPDVLRAYASIRMQSAMRVIVSYVDSERRSVRHAARWAMEQYGGNAIWILRTAHHNETGEHAPREWGWRRLTEQLYEHVDARRLAPVRAALDEGIAARDAGDLETMRARFDAVLARAPELEAADPVAEGYAQLGSAWLEEGRFADAAWAHRRALRLAPEHPRASAWRGAVGRAQAELDRARGVLDARHYEAHPTDEAAVAALASVPSTARASARGTARERWGFAAAGIMVLLGLALLWRPRRTEAVDPALDDTTLDETLEAPSPPEADVTLADQTLPG